MALIDQTKHLAEYIEANRTYLNRNIELFDIHEGNLKPYVKDILKRSLSEQYYSRIKDRIYPINILKRIIDKLAQAYTQNPRRVATSSQETLEFYELSMMIDQKMNSADEFAQMFKGYALEPYIRDGVPRMRVLPFDRFLVESSSIIDPTHMTRFYKYVGKHTTGKNGQEKEVDVWFVYTDDEFVPIDSNGNVLHEFLVDDNGNTLNGVNPLGFIPFFYGNRSEYKILPTQDTDTLELTKLLPVQFSDLAGTILFQCFSIIYGIDVDSENMVMSPNAFWSMKSDPTSDKKPEVGTITPTADIDKVLKFISEVFATWMESRGIRVGSIGHSDGRSSASGIAKMIDEMDTFEAKKKSVEYFKKEEYQYWQLVKNMHNHWVSSGELEGMALLPEDWEVFTEFDEPQPITDRTSKVNNVVKERDAGIISTRTAIEMLHPKWSDKDVEEEMKRIREEI